MVHAQSGEDPFGDQPKDQAVSRVEDEGIFDAHPHQVRNGEKSAVIDGFVDVLPVGQSVILFSKQTLQIAQTARVAFFAVVIGKILNRSPNARFPIWS